MVKVVAKLLERSILIAVLLSACSSSDECADAVAQNTNSVSADYRRVASACEADYNASQRASSALATAKSLGDLKDWEALNIFSDAIDEPVLHADVLMVAAKYYRRAGDSQLAQERHLAAINVYRKFDKHRELGKALYHAFRVVWMNSDHRSALRFAGEALEIAQRSENKGHEISALGNLVTVFQEVGSVGAAQHALDQQRPMLAEYASVGQAIDADIDQGLVHMDRQKYGLATYSFTKALESAAGSKNYDALRGLNLNLVWANLKLGRLDTASSYLEQAWSYAERKGSSKFALNYYQAKLHFAKRDYELAKVSITKVLKDKSTPVVWQWDALHQAGLIAQALGRETNAIEYFQAAIGESDKLRSSLGFDDLKAHMLAHRREPYEALFLTYFSQGDTFNAFAIAEQAKSKSFLEAYLQNQKLANQPYSAASVASESERIDDLLQHLDFMRSSPVVRPHRTSELLTALREHQVLSFFVAQQRIFSIVTSGGEITINEVNSDYSSFLKVLREYKAKLGELEVLQTLGSLLLAHVDLSHRSNHLYISPDGVLGDLVFSSLHFDGKFLVEHKSVSLIPSAGALFEINNYAHIDNGDSTLVVGNPNNDLSLAQVELQEVAQRLKTKAITGKLAVSALVQKVQTPKVLHLATHSGVGHLGPWVRFADGDIPAKQFAQNIKASKLAVFASCSSAAKDGKNLWGSLGGLFLSNGTPSVFVTQWSVKDEITQAVVSEFYDHFTSGNNASESLALVQRGAIAKGLAPQDWGAYIVLGR